MPTASDYVIAGADFFTWTSLANGSLGFDASTSPVQPGTILVGQSNVSLQAVMVDPASDYDAAAVSYPDPALLQGNKGGGGAVTVNRFINPRAPLIGRLSCFPALNGFVEVTPYREATGPSLFSALVINWFTAAPSAIVPRLILRGYIGAPPAYPLARNRRINTLGWTVQGASEELIARVPFFGRSAFSLLVQQVGTYAGAFTIGVRGANFSSSVVYTASLGTVAIGGAGASGELCVTNKFCDALEIFIVAGGVATSQALFNIIVADSNG